jgi:peptide/nickel transport system substrate-binding protein
MVLERNPNYWDAPKPYLDELIFKPIPDAAQRADTFISGDGDLVDYVTASLDTKRIEDKGFKFGGTDLFGGQGVWFNTTKAPFDDVRVRQAFVMALDPADLNDQVTGGGAQMVDTIFPKSSPFYADIPQTVNQPDQAQKLVDAYVAEHGDINFRLVYSAPQATWAPAMAQQLEELKGVTVQLDLVTDPATRLQQRDFDATFGAIVGIDPMPQIMRLTSSSASNAGAYSNADLDALLQDAAASGDTAKRKDDYTKAQQIIVDEVPFYFLYSGLYRTAPGKDLKGYSVYDVGEVDFPALWKG